MNIKATQLLSPCTACYNRMNTSEQKIRGKSVTARSSEDIRDIIRNEILDSVKVTGADLSALVTGMFTQALDPKVVWSDLPLRKTELTELLSINQGNVLEGLHSLAAIVPQFVGQVIVDLEGANATLRRINKATPTLVLREAVDSLERCSFSGPLSLLSTKLSRIVLLSNADRAYRQTKRLQEYFYSIDTNDYPDKADITWPARLERVKLKQTPGPDGIFTVENFATLGELLLEMSALEVETTDVDAAEGVLGFLQELNEIVATTGHLILMYGLLKTRANQLSRMRG